MSLQDHMNDITYIGVRSIFLMFAWIYIKSSVVHTGWPRLYSPRLVAHSNGSAEHNWPPGSNPPYPATRAYRVLLNIHSEWWYAASIYRPDPSTACFTCTSFGCSTSYWRPLFYLTQLLPGGCIGWKAKGVKTDYNLCHQVQSSCWSWYWNSVPLDARSC